jgi:LEA14-like dessication related protein
MKLKMIVTQTAAILPLLLLISCNVFKMPDYKEFKNLKVEKWGMAESTVTMDLVYYNPNKIGFQVKRTEADVYVDGVYLGKAISDTLIKVARKSDFVIPLRIKADMKNVFKNAWSALSNKTVLIKANGTISAGVAGIFKSIPMNYEGRHEMGLFAP